MYSIFSALLAFALFSSSVGAPTCEPGAFCFNPNEFTKIVVAREGNHLALRVSNQNSTSGNIHLVQSNGQESLVYCGSDSKHVTVKDGVATCQAQVPLDQFDPKLPLSIRLSDSTISDSFSLDSLTPPLEAGLTKDQRRQFSKAHAILMILGWLFLVPTGFMFARLGKDLFQEEKLFGMPVWFQVHRAANFMGCVCICASMICIFISTQWKWKGTGSGSKYWTEVHTDLGVISTVLALAQPINSLFRCGPGHSQRIIFNWAHRCVGVVAYALAMTAIIIAAVQFKRIWSEPLMELVLACLPIVICLAASVVFTLLENDRFSSKTYGPHILKAPIIFWSVGVFFCTAVALSLLVVNGYKNV